MKKILLSLGLLSFAAGAFAQAPSWVLRNTAGAIQTAPEQLSRQAFTVNATTCWQLMSDFAAAGATSNPPINNVARTVNGTDWTYSTITGGSGFGAANISAIDGNTAYVGQFNDATGLGEVLKTTNGGAAWTKVTTTQFTTPGSFLDWVYFFDVNNGVAFGDPINGSYEIYTTANGGTSWTRVSAANIPAPASGEAGLVLSYFALGNTVWAGTGNASATAAARVYKSTDRGLTWTVSSNTPLKGSISRLAFRDANNGIAYNTSAGLPNVIKTTDGGATWTAITPASNAQGRFYTYDIDAIPGAFISVGTTGVSNPSAPQTERGSSVSLDGITWKDIDRGVVANSARYFTVDAVSPTAAFIGSSTAPFTDTNPGSGGFFQLSGNLLTPLATAVRNAELERSMSVYPNPSATGVFQLQLTAAVKSGAQVRAVDMLGREVFKQQLNATTVAAQMVTIDLSKEKAGLYTLELRTAQGNAQYKVVVE